MAKASLNPKDLKLLDLMIQEFIEGDPGIYPFEDVDRPTPNVSDPRQMELLRQNRHRVAGKFGTHPLRRGDVRYLVRELTNPPFFYGKASAKEMSESIKRAQETHREFMGARAKPPQEQMKLLNKIAMQQDNARWFAERSIAHDQEFTRRKDFLRSVKKFLRKRGVGGGVLGMAAGLGALPLLLGHGASKD